MIERRFLRAYLLLLLDEQPSHGYEVLARLQALGWNVDSGRAYRALRDMESEGLLGSQWRDSPNGPRQRAYSVTAAGREALRTLIDEVRDARALASAFLTDAMSRP